MPAKLSPKTPFSPTSRLIATRPPRRSLRAARLRRQPHIIIQARLDAGQDTPIDLTSARLSSAQLRLNLLHTEDEQAIDQFRLAHLTGLPADGLVTIPGSIPEITAPAKAASGAAAPLSPAIASAVANAQAKREIAFGDARYLYRPQIAFGAQYNRFARYNNYDLYYRNFQSNNAEIGIQITVPFFDMGHKAKARESAADALHAEREADQASGPVHRGPAPCPTHHG